MLKEGECNLVDERVIRRVNVDKKGDMFFRRNWMTDIYGSGIRIFFNFYLYDLTDLDSCFDLNCIWIKLSNGAVELIGRLTEWCCYIGGS